MNIAIIVSGGVGKRFNDPIPKQYQEINGKQIISFVIDALKKTETIDKIVVASDIKYKDLMENFYGVVWAPSGSERNQTVRNALEHIKKHYQCENVIVLDAVMPLIKPETVDVYMRLLNKHQAVATAQKITVSLGSYDFHEIDRERYYLLSSPEAFRFKLLDKYLNENSTLVEITQHFPKNTDIYLYFDNVNNFKLVYKKDLRLMQFMLKEEGLI
jgi:2-C-methyl-D-erythritol 4-phosphate cytidylyltransferase